MRHSYGLIVFDLDGTLADTIYDLAFAAEHMAGKYADVTVSEQLAKRAIGNGLKLFLERIYAYFGITPDSFEDDLAEFKEYYFEHACVRTKLYDDTLFVLDCIKNMKIPMCVVTMKPLAPAIEILKHFGIYEYFDDIIAGDIMEEPKPSPISVIKLAAAHNVGCGEVLVIGDGMTDVNMAANAGADAAALTSGYGRKEEILASGAAHIIDKLSDIIDVL